MRPQGAGHTTYETLPDGGFVVLHPTDDALSARTAEVITVSNWLEELKQKLAIK